MDKILQKFKTFFKNKRYQYTAIVVGVIIIALLIYIFDLFPDLAKKFGFGQKGKVIEENLIIPDTKKVTVIEGRFASQGIYQTPLVPKSDKDRIIVPNAIITIKGSHDISRNEAEKWSADVKPIFIKSLGAITLEGKSGAWQVVFGSKAKKSGYEIIVQGDKIIFQKEISSDSFGYDLPISWRDSDKVISVLQILPQFSDATISAISLYYNTDGKVWRYILTTSRGLTSTSAQ